MKKIFYITSIAALFLIGCTDLEEIVYDKVPGDIYPENAEQLANLTVDAYTKLKPLCDDQGWWLLAQEVTSDELVFPTRKTDWDDGGKWRNMFTHSWTNDIEGVNSQWGKYWDGITRCNQTLDILATLTITPEVASSIAEMKTLRSFYYYLVLDNYGDTPYLTTAKQAPDFLPSKISRAAAYDSIVTCLEQNYPLLVAADKKNAVTRYTAFALLAKLKLNENVYKGTSGTDCFAQSASYCDSVLSSGKYTFASTVSETFITQNEKASEIIFSIPYDEKTYQGFRIHMRSLYYEGNVKYNSGVGPWNGCAVVYDHYNSYDNTDLRKTAYFLSGPQVDASGQPLISNVNPKLNNQVVINPVLPGLTINSADDEVVKHTGARICKFEIKVGYLENLSNDFPLFRLTDIMLTKAECLLRLNGPNTVTDGLVNQVRKRAAVVDFSGTTLDMLLAERGRELFLEGYRRQDLIRFGKFYDARWEKPASTPWNGVPRNIFPVPKWATDANPNLLN